MNTQGDLPVWRSGAYNLSLPLGKTSADEFILHVEILCQLKLTGDELVYGKPTIKCFEVEHRQIGWSLFNED